MSAYGDRPADERPADDRPDDGRPDDGRLADGRGSQDVISICMVTLQARDYLRGCLESLAAHPPRRPVEIIVVDNGSTDGTVAMLRQDFPQVQVIENGRNDGFGRPTNQALHRATGSWLLLLNPDTVVHPGALDTLVDYLVAHPAVGICGPKILNSDGSLQGPCRRGEPRPWAVFSYFSGLAARFPQHPYFSEYLLSYHDEDEIHPVAGVSGACMLVRRALWEAIGGLDEDFFAYQEDADYCHRARAAGWQVMYVPTAQIMHYGGQGGTRAQPYRALIEWHRSYYLYYRKHLARDYFFLFNWLYYLAMAGKLALSLAINLFRREKVAGKPKPRRSGNP